jgi:(p)ppGpp synthase/HD superfamily hydrolase
VAQGTLKAEKVINVLMDALTNDTAIIPAIRTATLRLRAKNRQSILFEMAKIIDIPGTRIETFNMHNENGEMFVHLDFFTENYTQLNAVKRGLLMLPNVYEAQD